MWIFNLIILLLFLFGFILSLKYRGEWMINIDKKEHKFYILYPLASLILHFPYLQRVISNNNKVNTSLKALNISDKNKNLQELYWYKQVAQMMIILILFNLLSIFGYLYDISNSVIINDKYLLRPDYGQGSDEIKLRVSFKADEEQSLSHPVELPEEKDITIEIKERRYTANQVEMLFEKALDYLETRILGNNESFQQVKESLNFISSIPGTSIAVNWIPEDYTLIQSNGAISNEKVEDSGVDTSVTAVLQYEEFKKEKVFNFRIIPKHYTEEELLAKALEEEIKNHGESTAEEKYQELPERVRGYLLEWKSSDTKSGVTLLFLGIVLAALVWLRGEKELEKQMKLRKEQMLLDYPEIVNKFTLLVNAGMTIRQAWSKITEDYQYVQAQGGAKRYAYEEMLATTYELKLGISEVKAYEQFGSRIGLIPYMKFSSLVIQNLKKGTKGFTELLIYEASQAFEQRKETAKRLGEEAGTKLLFPMMLLLIIVFLIIMIPAFMSFQI